MNWKWLYDLIESFGYELEDYRRGTPATYLAIWRAVRGYTVTSPSRIFGLLGAVEYLTTHKVPGAVVECGVWKGGSMFAALRKLVELGDTSRPAYFFDLFEASTEQEVKERAAETRYRPELVTTIKGDVLATLDAIDTGTIALLRLDTNTYETTKRELEVLWPRLAPGGVLILDDYGHWPCFKRAVDEFFTAQGIKPWLHRIDYTGRIVVKA